MENCYESMLTAPSACVSNVLALVFRVRLYQASDTTWAVVPLGIAM